MALLTAYSNDKSWCVKVSGRMTASASSASSAAYRLSLHAQDVPCERVTNAEI